VGKKKGKERSREEKQKERGEPIDISDYATLRTVRVFNIAITACLRDAAHSWIHAESSNNKQQSAILEQNSSTACSYCDTHYLVSAKHQVWWVWFCCSTCV